MDRYTKLLLTIIAAALVWIAVRDGLWPPNAVAAPVDTRIDIAEISVARHRALPVVVSGEVKCVGGRD